MAVQPGGIATGLVLAMYASMTWALALLGTGVDVNGTDKDAVYVAALDLRVGWRGPALMTASFVLYFTISSYYKNKGPHMKELYAGYPLWCYWVSYWHGFFFLPLALYWLLCTQPHDLSLGLGLPDLGGDNVGHHFADLFTAKLGLHTGTVWHEWLPRGATAYRAANDAVFYLVGGYLLKDYTLYDAGLENVFVLHHVLSIGGCIVSIQMPELAGLVALQGVQAEMASSFYNLQISHPSTITRAAYAVFMGASTYVSPYLGWCIFSYEPLPALVRWTYLFLTTLIVILRTAGYALTILGWLRERSTSTTSSESREKRAAKKAQ